MVNQQKLEYVKRHNLSLDCMFIITVEETWKVSMEKMPSDPFKLIQNNSIQISQEETIPNKNYFSISTDSSEVCAFRIEEAE